MNPPSSRDDSPPPTGEGGEGGAGAGGGGLYMDAYEVAFPLGENVERPTPYHLTQGQYLMEEPGAQDLHPSQYHPFLLVSNLRTHLYISLEKNTSQQKRIEELEEERNFLRRQLDRFIVSLHTPDEGGGDPRRAVKVQTASSPPPPSPMTTRSGMTLKWVSGPRARSSAPIPAAVKQEFHLEEDKYYTDDEYVEEEEEEEDDDDEDSSAEKGSRKKSRGRGCREPRMKMRRVFRITHSRERQRVKDPDGVLIRYKKILTTYQRVRSMSRAFQIHGVDRNTMASTSPIAELLLVAPEKVMEVGEFEAPKEKLLDYARRCYKTMDEQTHAKVQTMKKTHKLLPISYRFRN